jgi:RNA polymerase sigma-70 factor (ECF subfamily)
MSALGADRADGPAVDVDRFYSPGTDRSPGRWALAPAPWPEHALLASETRAVIASAVDQLQPAQRAVITLRDIDGWSAEETCRALGLSEGNQRVLLHRARSRVRAAIETYFGAVEATAA